MQRLVQPECQRPAATHRDRIPVAVEADGIFGAESLNVLVAGGGGISEALIAELLALNNVSRVFCLHRSEVPPVADPRYTPVAFDAEDESSITDAVAEISSTATRLHLVINTVGLLHNDTLSPEKRLRDVSARALQQLFAINAVFLPLLASAVSPLMRHDEPAVLASLSARVGSITDNQSGGWYSYRASKAAHNMLLKTLAREWRVSHRNVCVLALHPGTVATRLSTPFTPANYSRRVLQPEECARALLQVIGASQASDSGRFLDWQGEDIPW